MDDGEAVVGDLALDAAAGAAQLAGGLVEGEQQVSAAVGFVALVWVVVSM